MRCEKAGGRKRESEKPRENLRLSMIKMVLMEPLKDLLIFEQTKEMKSLKMKTFQFCIVWRRRRASLSFKSYLHARSEYQTAFDCHKHSIISIIKAFIPLARHKKAPHCIFPLMFYFLLRQKRVDDKNHDSTNKFSYQFPFAANRNMLLNVSCCCWKTNNRKTTTRLFYCSSLI